MKELDRTLLQQLSRVKAPDCPSIATLGDFLDGKGSAEERQTLETHLHSCPACLNRLIELRELALLEKEGETPARELVEEVKGLVPSPGTQQEPVQSVLHQMGQPFPPSGRLSGKGSRFVLLGRSPQPLPSFWF